MNEERIRKVLRTRPFRPLKITLAGGVPVVVRHPENFVVREGWIIVVEREGPIISDVVAVQRLRNGASRGA